MIIPLCLKAPDWRKRMLWPLRSLRRIHVLIPALQEAERQGGLDTILAALAQKGAQEAALALELAALRGQEQVGMLGPGSSRLDATTFAQQPGLPLAGSVSVWSDPDPSLQQVPVCVRSVCRVQHRLDVWRSPCHSMLLLHIGSQGRLSQECVLPGPARCSHAGLTLLQAIKDRRVEREQEYAAQREAEFQASLDAEAAAQRALRDRYSADAAQQVQEYRRQQEERQAAKRAAHEDMARDMAWQVTDQGAASQGTCNWCCLSSCGVG